MAFMWEENKRERNKMKRKGIYLVILSLFLVAMPSYGLFTCLPTAFKGGSFPLDMVYSFLMDC